MPDETFVCPIGRRLCHDWCDQWNDNIVNPSGEIEGHIAVASCFLKDEGRWQYMMGMITTYPLV